MRCLTLTQPWATLVAVGAKRIETRSWPTSYRGPVAVHAARAMPDWAEDLLWEEPFRSVLAKHLGTDDPSGWPDVLPRGAIVAVADLVHCLRFTGTTAGWLRRCAADGLLPPHEAAFGDFSPGRFGLLLADVRPLPRPVPCRGALGLWWIPPDVAAALGPAPAGRAGVGP